MFAGREAAADRRRDAGRHGGGGASCSPTRRAARSTWSSSSSTSGSTRARPSGTSARSSCATSRRSFGRWQAGLADAGWNSLYWNNHDQPRVVSRFGDDGEHRVRSAKMLGTVLHLHRGTPYVYQGEELGMTNVPFAAIEDFRDIESLNHYAEAVAAGDDPTRAARAAGDEPRQRPHADAVGRLARTPASPPARRGSPSTPTTPRSTPRPARADPDSVFHHYRRLIELRHTEPAVAHGDFTMLLPDDERVYAFTRRHERRRAARARQLLRRATVTVDLPGWADAEIVIGESGEGLRPWESRVYRRYCR